MRTAIVRFFDIVESAYINKRSSRAIVALVGTLIIFFTFSFIPVMDVNASDQNENFYAGATYLNEESKLRVQVNKYRTLKSALYFEAINKNDNFSGLPEVDRAYEDLCANTFNFFYETRCSYLLFVGEIGSLNDLLFFVPSTMFNILSDQIFDVSSQTVPETDAPYFSLQKLLEGFSVTLSGIQRLSNSYFLVQIIEIMCGIVLILNFAGFIIKKIKFLSRYKKLTKFAQTTRTSSAIILPFSMLLWVVRVIYALLTLGQAANFPEVVYVFPYFVVLAVSISCLYLLRRNYPIIFEIGSSYVNKIRWVNMAISLVIFIGLRLIFELFDFLLRFIISQFGVRLQFTLFDAMNSDDFLREALDSPSTAVMTVIIFTVIIAFQMILVASIPFVMILLPILVTMSVSFQLTTRQIDLNRKFLRWLIYCLVYKFICCLAPLLTLSLLYLFPPSTQGGLMLYIVIILSVYSVVSLWPFLFKKTSRKLVDRFARFLICNIYELWSVLSQKWPFNRLIYL